MASQVDTRVSKDKDGYYITFIYNENQAIRVDLSLTQLARLATNINIMLHDRIEHTEKTGAAL